MVGLSAAQKSQYANDNKNFFLFSEPINIFQSMMNSGNEAHLNAPIRLCYHRGVHYNSIIDPHKATIGVGLGKKDFFKTMFLLTCPIWKPPFFFFNVWNCLLRSTLTLVFGAGIRTHVQVFSLNH